MANGYTKLFGSILGSTIWREDLATKVVWVTMMALADAHGEIQASIPGLAHFAGASLEETEAALAKFLAPDKYSRTPDFDGRRIEPIDGGWRLLNHGKYRFQMSDEERRERDRRRKQDYRDRKRTCPTGDGTEGDNTGHVPPVPNNDEKTADVPEISHTEADTEADTKEETKEETKEQSKTGASSKTRNVKVTQGLALVPGFDGHEWCLKTLRSYPGSDQSIAVPPPALANLYQDLIEREAPGRGGTLAAAEWFLALVQRYAAEHPSGEFVMGFEKFLRTGYVQQGKGGGGSRVDGEGEGTWLMDADSGEKVWLPKRTA